MSDSTENLLGLENIADKEAAKELENIRKEVPGLVAAIQDRFERAENGRAADEMRWQKNYADYRGKYTSGTDNLSREPNRSKVFVKIPKTKTLAAYGQLLDVLFPTTKSYPLEIRPTEIPYGIAEYAHLADKNETESEIPAEWDVGYVGDGRDAVLGGAAHKYPEGDWVAGPAAPNKPEIKPADLAAKVMNKTIQDQLTETDASKVLRSALFESCLYGAGVVKGPFTETRLVHDWKIDMDKDTQEVSSEYSPQEKDIPVLSAPSIWNIYPDPSTTCADDCEFMIERHIMTGSNLRALKRRPFFNKEGINQALLKGPNYFQRGWEHVVTDKDYDDKESTRYEVLEFWGTLDISLAEEIGLDLGDDFTGLDEAQFNVWICGDEILRVVVNPFIPKRLPYHIFPYEFNPRSLWGIGVVENMADATEIMNGHIRMAIDNLALSGNMIFDVDEAVLVQDQDFELYPGKVFRRHSGQTQAGINAIKFPNTTTENMQMFDRARQLADEETGMPSYSHGQTGVNSTTRTASGMSMLLGAASLNIKTVVKNVDDYLLRPLGEALFHWNMQFNPDPRIKGDLEVKALGSEAVMQKEVRSQRLTQLLQIAANPTLATFVNLPYIIEEIASSTDIDPERAINSPEEAKIQAEIIGASGQQIAQAGQGPEGAQVQGGTPPKAPNTGPTGNGGGNIGTGDVPMPGEDSFSGNI